MAWEMAWRHSVPSHPQPVPILLQSWKSHNDYLTYFTTSVRLSPTQIYVTQNYSVDRNEPEMLHCF